MKKKNKWKERLHECTHNANFMIGFVIIVSVILVAIFADQIAPFDYTAQKTGGRLEAPSSAHLFGTDDLGRDIFAIKSENRIDSLAASIKAITKIKAEGTIKTALKAIPFTEYSEYKSAEIPP